MFIHCVKLAGKNKLTPNNCYVFSGSIDFSGKKMDFGNLDFGIEIRCRRGVGLFLRDNSECPTLQVASKICRVS